MAALILIASPVRGLRPVRAARLPTAKVPNPTRETEPPFFNVAFTALMVDSNTERQTAKDIRDAKTDGLIDQFFYGSMSAEYLMDQIYAM